MRAAKMGAAPNRIEKSRCSNTVISLVACGGYALREPLRRLANQSKSGQESRRGPSRQDRGPHRSNSSQTSGGKSCLEQCKYSIISSSTLRARGSSTSSQKLRHAEWLCPLTRALPRDAISVIMAIAISPRDARLLTVRILAQPLFKGCDGHHKKALLPAGRPMAGRARSHQ